MQLRWYERNWIDSVLSEIVNAIYFEIKDYYDNNDFDMNDVVEISRGTIKEDELFDYAGVPDYLKTSKCVEKEKDDYEISL